MHMKNDVGVLVDLYHLSLWEHQSTLCPNIPYRFLCYYAAMMKRYVRSNRLNEYGSKRMILPMPKFYVFYNGKDPAPKKTTLKLSDLYYNTDEEAQLELNVTQFNINGYPDGPEQCRQLYEYEWFMEKIRTYSYQTDLTTAVGKALEEMSEDFTIREWLMANRSEVLEMSLFYFDEEFYKECVRKETMEEGFEAGKNIKTAELIQRKMASGLSFEEACMLFELTEEEIRSVKEYMNTSAK